MGFSARLQLLTCLMVYASSAHGIMVKFGTKNGPIEPPPPEQSLPPPQPYKIPAPVWEERSNDTPDPNAQWRPQFFIPQPRYTHVVYSDLVPPSVHAPQPLSNAQRFVNSYIPTPQPSQHQPIQAQPVQNYFTPHQVLSSQSLPGFGLRYFVPTYANDVQNGAAQLRPDDAKQNQIETNAVNVRTNSEHDLTWQIEKDIAGKNIRNTRSTSRPFVYQWPAYVAPRHQ